MAPVLIDITTQTCSVKFRLTDRSDNTSIRKLQPLFPGPYINQWSWVPIMRPSRYYVLQPLFPDPYINQWSWVPIMRPAPYYVLRPLFLVTMTGLSALKATAPVSSTSWIIAELAVWIKLLIDWLKGLVVSVSAQM